MMDWFGMGRRRPKIPAATKQLLYERQKKKCNGCGRELPLDLMDADHKKAFSKGHGENIGNLQLLCRTCNVRKGSGTMRRLEIRNAAKGIKTPTTAKAKAAPKGKTATAKAATKNKATAKTTTAKKPKKKAPRDPWAIF